MLKHLYYILPSDLSTYDSTWLNSDFTSEGIPIDESVTRINTAFLDILKTQMVNAPTLFTNKADFIEYLHYYVRMYSLPLYHKSKLIGTITQQYLKSGGTDTRTISNSGNDSFSESNSDTIAVTDSVTGTDTTNESNNRRYADTPTSVSASTDFVDTYTSEQEKNVKVNDTTTTTNKTFNQQNSQEKTNSTIYGKRVSDVNSKEVDLKNYMQNIDRLNRTLYNDIEKLITEKLMYQLLYDIDNN